MKIFIGAKQNSGYSNPKIYNNGVNSFNYKSKMNQLNTDVFQKIHFTSNLKTNTTKAFETGEFLYNPYPKMLHNVVIEKTYTTTNTDHYKISNAQVFDHEIDTLTKNNTAEFSLRESKQDNELIYKWESPKFDLFPVGLYAALEKSCENQSTLLIEVTNPTSLSKYVQKGFELSRKSYQYYDLENGIQNSNSKILERIFNIEEIKEGRGKVYVELTPQKALKFKERILNYLRININNNSIEKFAQRGEFLEIPKVGRYSIRDNKCLELEELNGYNPDGVLTIGRYDGRTKVVNNNLDLNAPTILNGFNIEPTVTLDLKVGDNITIGKNVYMFVDKGLRNISNDQKTFFKLFPTGLRDVHFEQSAIEDCYFLAALNSILQTTEGQELVAHMTSESKQDEFKVRFPGFPEHPITVTPDEIDKLNGVKSESLGIKVLETAFGKLLKELDWKDDVDKKGNLLSLWLSGGWPDDALYVLTGTKSIFLNSKNEKNNKYNNALSPPFNYKMDPYENPFSLVECLLNKLANKEKNFIVTASTYTHDNTRSHIIDDTEKGILKKGHALSIIDIDKTNRTIMVACPGNTKKLHKIDYEYFFSYFNTIGAVELPFKS